MRKLILLMVFVLIITSVNITAGADENVAVTTPPYTKPVSDFVEPSYDTFS